MCCSSVPRSVGNGSGCCHHSLAKSRRRGRKGGPAPHRPGVNPHALVTSSHSSSDAQLCVHIGPMDSPCLFTFSRHLSCPSQSRSSRQDEPGAAQDEARATTKAIPQIRDSIWAGSQRRKRDSAWTWAYSRFRGRATLRPRNQARGAAGTRSRDGPGRVERYELRRANQRFSGGRQKQAFRVQMLSAEQKACS